jgi:group I intron endonuclease
MKLINYNGNADKTGIYCIRNLINNKTYIGSTKNSFTIRKNKHLCLLRKNIHYNEHLQNAWNYYGENNFNFEILFICSSNDCEKYEGDFIKLYSSNKRKYGYNIACVSSYQFEYKISNDHNHEKSLRKKERASHINGLTTNERGISKPFKQYDLNGSLINEHKSSKEYLLKYGGSKSHLSIVLNKRKLYYHNTIVLFSNDELTYNDIIKANQSAIKKIDLFDRNGSYIKTYDSAKECANFIKCKESEIRMCCLNKRNRIKNFITKYKNYE